jgi:hypothetical protein
MTDAIRAAMDCDTKMVAMFDTPETINMLRDLCAQRTRLPLDCDHRLLYRATDELDRLSKIVVDSAVARKETLTSWILWVEQNSSADIAEWLRLYGHAYFKNTDSLSDEDERRVKVVFDAVLAKCEEAAREIERLRSERDEARRNVCYAESNGRIGRRGTSQGYAKLMGWDCFKETP